MLRVHSEDPADHIVAGSAKHRRLARNMSVPKHSAYKQSFVSAEGTIYSQSPASISVTLVQQVTSNLPAPLVGNGRLGNVHANDEAWQQKQGTAVLACPVTVAGLNTTIEAKAISSCVEWVLGSGLLGCVLCSESECELSIARLARQHILQAKLATHNVHAQPVLVLIALRPLGALVVGAKIVPNVTPMIRRVKTPARIVGWHGLA